MRTEVEYENALDAIDDIFKALPKKRQPEFLGHLNEISLCLEDGKAEARRQRIEAEAIDKARMAG